MAVQGVDYSSARPSPSCLYGEGKRFAVRYTNLGEPRAKTITLSEATKLTNAGLRVVTVFEESAGHMLGGASAGRAAAEASWRLGKAAGMHPQAPHYFALDVDPNALSDAELSRCAAYLDAAVAVLGKNRVGLYAGLRGIEKLRGHCTFLWQTYAWSGGNWAPGLHLRQYKNNVELCGGSVDLNDAPGPAYYGQWGVNVAMASDLERTQDFARSCDPIPYRMTYNFDRSGIDCSGYMSLLTNELLNVADPWVRLFSTGTIRDAVAAGRLPMLHTGLGDANDFNLGVVYPWEMSSGIGHMAGTLGGLNVESRGGDGVVNGPTARGATHPLFRHHFHVKIDSTGNAGGGVDMSQYGPENWDSADWKAFWSAFPPSKDPDDRALNLAEALGYWPDGGLKGIRRDTRKLLERPSITAEALAAAVVAALPTTSGGAGLTKADVEDAIRAVFQDAGQP